MRKYNVNEFHAKRTELMKPKNSEFRGMRSYIRENIGTNREICMHTK